MRSNGKIGPFWHVLGPFLVLAVPACALAQGDWQIQPSHENTYNEGYLPPNTSPFPAANAHLPLDTTPRLPRPATCPPGDTRVLQAAYETPAQTTSSQREDVGSGATARATAGLPGSAQDTVRQRNRGTTQSDSNRILPRGAKPDYLPRRATPPQTDRGATGGLQRAWKTGAALALVLGLFCLVAWIMRRAAPKTALSLPAEVVETLGRSPLAGRQYVHLIRCGSKLLLVNVAADRAKTLTEITDPIEVQRLTGLCEQARGGRAAAAFRQVFEQFSHPGRPPQADERELSAGSLFGDDRASFLEGRDV